MLSSMRMPAPRRFVCLVAVLTTATIVLADSSAEPFAHGVAAGDLTATSVVLWTRTASPQPVTLRLDPGAIERRGTTRADADATIAVEIDGLTPDTAYRYRFVTDDGAAVEGRFRTPTTADADRAVAFVVGGDVGGQAFCRHRDKGYAIFRAAAAAGAAGAPPDFFIANGDMIYADGICPAEGPGGFPNVPGGFPSIADVDWTSDIVLDVFLDHWRYNRTDVHSRDFFSRVPVYVQWDDHEVINDFGAPWARWPVAPEREGYGRMVELGRDALFAWNPIRRHPDEPHRLYRSFRWGRHVELFLLDARSYRSRNDVADEPGAGKTLLGDAQRRWLLDGLKASDATWKIVSSDVPLSIPTGWPAERYGRDAFATGEGDGFETRTGAERELRMILETLDRENVENVVVVATDVHFAAFLRYDLDLDGDGDHLLLHELVSGPMNAVAVAPKAPDPTFGPDVLYMGGRFFNIARVLIDEDGILRAEIVDEDGEPRFGSELILRPSTSPRRPSSRTPSSRTS
ncbi:MAG: alkaline phosphatase D family protein, partial [Acidobacteriota bacterium]